MAKYRKKNSTGMVVATTFSIILALLAIAYAVLSACLHSFNPVVWFTKGDTAIADTTDNVILDVEDNDNVYDMAGQIMFMSDTPIEDMTVTIRATVLPEDADNKRVTWESNSEAVTVTPSAEDSRVATVRIVDVNFAPDTVITCRSVDNPQAFATCTIRTLTSINDVELEASLKNVKTMTFGRDYQVLTYAVSKVGSSGGAVGDMVFTYSSVCLTNDFIEVIDRYLAQEGYTDISSYGCWDEYTDDGFSLPNSPWETFCGESKIPEDVYNRAFKNAVQEDGTLRMCEVDISANYTFQGNVIGYAYTELYYSFDVSNIWIGVDNVELDQNEVIIPTT